MTDVKIAKSVWVNLDYIDDDIVESEVYYAGGQIVEGSAVWLYSLDYKQVHHAVVLQAPNPYVGRFQIAPAA